jgi:hypothetical protein
MRTKEEVAQVKSLYEKGVSKRAIAKETGIPRGTVYSIINRGFETKFKTPSYNPHDYITPDKYKHYAYALGCYLGDGCISKHPRTYVIRIATNSNDVDIISRQQRVLEFLFPNPVNVCKRECNCVDIKMYGSYLPTVFPQHGTGLKHKRKIKLEDWQLDICDKHPEFLFAGLVDTDGCRYIHTQKKYQWPTYQFTNMSEDIKDIFEKCCKLLGIKYSRTNHKNMYMRSAKNVQYIDNLLESVYTDLQ